MLTRIASGAEAHPAKTWTVFRRRKERHPACRVCVAFFPWNTHFYCSSWRLCNVRSLPV